MIEGLRIITQRCLDPILEQKNLIKGDIDLDKKRAFDYESPNGVILGFIEELDHKERLRAGGKCVSLPAHTKFLRIHYHPSDWEIGSTDSTTTQRRKNIINGGEDYFNFLRTMHEDPLFSSINLIVGRTSPDVARFAINRLGFYRADTSFRGGELRTIALSNSYSPPRSEVIYGFKNDLLLKAPAAYRLREKLITFEGRLPSHSLLKP